MYALIPVRGGRRNRWCAVSDFACKPRDNDGCSDTVAGIALVIPASLRRYPARRSSRSTVSAGGVSSPTCPGSRSSAVLLEASAQTGPSAWAWPEPAASCRLSPRWRAGGMVQQLGFRASLQFALIDASSSAFQSLSGVWSAVVAPPHSSATADHVCGATEAQTNPGRDTRATAALGVRHPPRSLHLHHLLDHLAVRLHDASHPLVARLHRPPLDPRRAVVDVERLLVGDVHQFAVAIILDVSTFSG